MRNSVRTSLALAAAMAIAAGALAAQQSAPSAGEKPVDMEKVQKDAQNPVADMMSFPFQLNSSYGLYQPYGRTQNILNVQPVLPFHLSEKWNLITRTIIPIMWQPQNADSGMAAGMGDINLSLFLSPAKPGKVIWGAGAAFGLPTRTYPLLGSALWSAGPSIVVLTMPGHFVLGLLAQNTWSFAGPSDQPSINYFYSQVFINYNIGKTGWYLLTQPIITADWTQPSNNQWTVPLGGGVGYIHRFGKLPPLNLQLSAYGYAVKQEGGPDWTLRSMVVVLLPK
ncbi:MAG TPA: hypothetical protein VMT93_06655 [Gemmatimonadaceae bacterium]|nr:hypothetical protein [Gemmatimonadaceae bacterium]